MAEVLLPGVWELLAGAGVVPKEQPRAVQQAGSAAEAEQLRSRLSQLREERARVDEEAARLQRRLDDLEENGRKSAASAAKQVLNHLRGYFAEVEAMRRRCEPAPAEASALERCAQLQRQVQERDDTIATLRAVAAAPPTRGGSAGGGVASRKTPAVGGWAGRRDSDPTTGASSGSAGAAHRPPQQPQRAGGARRGSATGSGAAPGGAAPSAASADTAAPHCFERSQTAQTAHSISTHALHKGNSPDRWMPGGHGLGLTEADFKEKYGEEEGPLRWRLAAATRALMRSKSVEVGPASPSSSGGPGSPQLGLLKRVAPSGGPAPGSAQFRSRSANHPQPGRSVALHRAETTAHTSPQARPWAGDVQRVERVQRQRQVAANGIDSASAVSAHSDGRRKDVVIPKLPLHIFPQNRPQQPQQAKPEGAAKGNPGGPLVRAPGGGWQRRPQ
eukprot:TRINITY_DN6778_c0_g3_i1.p1 TRINITY_DN6778_c0_g3~~TRINITY_DN6778_c0_g3_i1.p1  ORF type:complete len:480 (+),score=114.00 TRINITY_DN6778_c0_g3_i1:105-1442(+)